MSTAITNPQDNTNAGANSANTSAKPEGTPEQKPAAQAAAPEQGKPNDAPDQGKQPDQKPGDQKPGEQKPDAKADGKKDEKPQGAPEKYADFKLPEGMTADKAILEKTTALAKEFGLSQEAAQKLVDLGAEHAKLLLKNQQDAWGKVREGWVDSIKADKEFGGGKFDETIERAKRSLGKFGSPELIGLLENSGFGDNPEVIKLFARIDKAMGEDKFEDGSPSKVNTKSAADVIYGK